MDTIMLMSVQLAAIRKFFIFIFFNALNKSRKAPLAPSCFHLGGGRISHTGQLHWNVLMEKELRLPPLLLMLIWTPHSSDIKLSLKPGKTVNTLYTGRDPWDPPTTSCHNPTDNQLLIISEGGEKLHFHTASHYRIHSLWGRWFVTSGTR